MKKFSIIAIVVLSTGILSSCQKEANAPAPAKSVLTNAKADTAPTTTNSTLLTKKDVSTGD